MLKKSIDAFQMVSQLPFDQLCWAAVALSVERLRNSGSALQLCDVVERTPPNPTCCGRGQLSSAACNHIALLLPALQALGRARLGVLPEDPPNPATMDFKWNEIKREIDAGRVVCAGIDWNAGGKHFVAIWGYEEADDGSRTVYIKDPWYASSTPSFSQFVTAYLGAGRCCELDRTL